MKYQSLLLVLCTACASSETPQTPEVPVQTVNKPTASIEAKQVAAEAGTPYVAELQFTGGAGRLASGQQAKLEKNFSEISTSGKIEKVQVVSWADQEYPSVHTKELSEAQIKLAQKRADGIANYLKNKDIKNVETVNMAERPNALQSLTQSGGARLKKAFEVSGIPNTDSSVKVPSKRAHAIVIFYLKE